MSGYHALQGKCNLSAVSGATKVNLQKQYRLCCRSFDPVKQGRPGRSSYNRPNVKASAASDLISVTFFTTAAAGLVYSSIPLLNGSAKRNNQGKPETSGQSDIEPEGIKWGAMSVVSFIPLVNWTAWVFAAIDDEGQAAKYYAYAAVYALPVLRNGFSIDSFLVAAVLLCAAHVQIERVANTEPVGIEVPAVSDISKSARQLTDSTKEWSASVQETSQRRKQERQQLEEQNTEQYRHKLSADELASWDARLKDVRRKAKDIEDV